MKHQKITGRFLEFLNKMPGAVVFLEPQNNGKDFIIVEFNKKAEQIEGVKKEDVLGKSVLEAFPGVKKMGLLDVFREVYKKGGLVCQPVTAYEGKEGKSWRRNFIFRLVDGCIISIFNDASEEQRKREQLRKNEEKYRSIFNNIQDLYYRTDKEGFITDLSPSVEPLTGYTKEELLGKKAEEVYYKPEEREGFLRELKKKGRVNGYEVILQKKNGYLSSVIINSRLIIDDKGEVQGVEGMIHDVTELKKNEEKLQKMNDLMIGREKKMIELKEEIRDLKEEIKKLKEKNV